MRIAVHAGTLRGGGSRAVGQHLLAQFGQQGEHQFLVWTPGEWPNLETANLRMRPTARGVLAKFKLENFELERASKRFGAEVLLSLGDTSRPWGSLRHVLFVQQAFLAYPETEWGFVPSPAFRTKVRLMSHYFRLGIPGVERFVVQTFDMRHKLCDRWKIDPDRVEVIPSAVGPELMDLRRLPRDNAQRPDDTPTVIYVAGPGPHKNHRVLPGMLSGAVHRDVRCCVTLDPGDLPEFDDEVKRRGVSARIDYLGNLCQKAALARLRHATVAVIPSQLESFGLAYYEALALGVPILAADTNFAREACGDAARYAPARSAEAFARQLDQLLDSAALRSDLAHKGRERFDKTSWSWARIANRYLDVMRGIA